MGINSRLRYLRPVRHGLPVTTITTVTMVTGAKVVTSLPGRRIIGGGTGVTATETATEARMTDVGLRRDCRAAVGIKGCVISSASKKVTVAAKLARLLQSQKAMNPLRIRMQLLLLVGIPVLVCGA